MRSFETEMIARRFGLEPIPESVLRLTNLIARQDADLEAIAKVIREDPALTARLLRMTQRPGRNEQPSDESAVEIALMRSGLGLVFLLAMGDLLTRALKKTFTVMLALKLDAVNPRDVTPITEEHMLCEVDFRGKAIGKIQLRLTEQTGRMLAARMLSVPADLLSSSGEKDDAVNELANMIAGNFLSNLADAGLPCQLTVPIVYRTSEFTIRSVAGGICERMAFRSPEAKMFLDVSVNPWNDGRGALK
ncbi:MAG TPA: chemotaxis protein CheX [Verrucomicrobiae bacterium]|jgi:chemotaxis protein CheX